MVSRTARRVSLIPRIVVKNAHPRAALNEKFVRILASDILARVHKKGGACVLDILFVDDRAMRQYNKRYAGRDCLTDVLSFKLEEPVAGRGAFVGDIIISADTAKRQCELFNTSFEYELVLYVVHGILHLFGYDDLNVKDRARMRRRECLIMAYLSGRRNLSRVLTPR